jgi:nucleotide-binding universal stress UspA family protein
MVKILVPVEASDRCVRAVQYLVRLCRELGPAEIHLIRVEPTQGTEQDAVKEQAKERGRQAAAEACRLLDQAGLRYDLHMETGEVAPTIARLAKELHCDSIVMGTHGRSVVGKLLLGSVVAEVLQSVDIPVTLVR